ncbi:Cytochrome c oxidase (cbb3-type) subunit CcoP [hydrothermal vent metagenome]|uniref:Cytochrome c oxidase subunit III n=1 Tax=hydrothermal vent metagenome TaxID=652676 RepID=A0A3B1B8H3_9ZZZZ
MSDKKTNQVGDTGHVWDDNLRELLNEPPRWWMISFYASIAWVLVYFLLYPSIPLIDSHTKGIMGWTQIKEYKEDLEKIEQVRAPWENKLKGMSAAAILADSDLTNYTISSAKVLFGDRCAACHGAGGAGNPGFPVLADDDWLFGGSVESIQESITAGRQGMMPGYASQISATEVDELANFVMALSQGNGDSQPAGKALFDSSGCSGCHGADGAGMHMMGSANLTDGIWRFSSQDQLESVKYTIANGVNTGEDTARNAVMPSFENQLSAGDITKLAVFVHQLGGGQ